MAGTSDLLRDVSRFSRRWWLNGAKNFVWVAILTLLVWTYADMEVADTEKISLTVELTTGNDRDLVLLSPAEHRLALTVRGARANLRRFVSRYSNAVIEYDLAKSYGPETTAIPAKGIIASRIPELAELGLELVSVAPETLTDLQLDRRFRAEAPVEFIYTGAKLKQAPTLSMGFSVARSQWEKIQKVEPNPRLKTLSKDLKAEKTGERIFVEAEIVPSIAGIPVTPDQRTVRVPIEIEQVTGEKTIPIVVRVLSPPSWDEEDGVWKEYVLRRKDPVEWRKDVKVTGPLQDLERLTAADVDAYIVLTDDDKKPVDSWLSREVVVRFHKDLNVALSEKLAVLFKLEKLARPPAAP